MSRQTGCSRSATTSSWTVRRGCSSSSDRPRATLRASKPCSGTLNSTGYPARTARSTINSSAQSTSFSATTATSHESRGAYWSGRNGPPTRLDDRLLPGLVAGSRRRETKGLALMALGRYLEDKVYFVIMAKRSDGPFCIEWDRGNGKLWRPYDEAYERVLRSCDAAALGLETERIFARIVAEYADVVQAGRDPGDPDYPLQTVQRVIGEEAANRLAAHRSVTIGQPAPELSWTTQDGRTFKLSDFLGKVVVLAFWRDRDHWPSQRDFEHESEVVRELKGRPFALIAFSHKDPSETGFSLPFTRPDGSEAVPADGPILERLGVRSFPETIVIDAEGVVCMRCRDGRFLGEYVRGLVKDAEGRDKVKN